MAEAAEVELKVPCDSQYISLARLVIAGVGACAGLTVDDIDDMKVAVSEACANAIDHAFPAEDESSPKSAPTLIRLAARAGELRVEVEDVGQGFEPDRTQISRQKEPSVDGGLGLYLIHQLTDSVDVQSAPGSGTKVIMTKRSSRGPE